MKRACAVVCASLTLLLGGAAGAQPLAPCELPEDPPLVAELRRDLGVFAGDAFEGRAPGNLSGVDFLVRELTALGVEPAGTDGYLQPFTVSYGEALTPTSRVRLTRGGEVRELSPGPELLLGPGGAPGRAERGLVYVGHGLSSERAGWDEWRGANVRSRVVLILGGVPTVPDPLRQEALAQVSVRDRVATAARRGAAAVLVVEPDAGALPDRYAVGASSGIPVVRITRSQGAWLLGVTEASLAGQSAPALPSRVPGVSVRLDVQTQRRTRETVNVLGLVRGAAPTRDAGLAPVETSGALVVGAHHDHLGHGGGSSRAAGYDTIHNGADDNGSGSMAVLALARRVQRARLPRDLVVAWFGGEELGLLGSEHFVAHRPPAAAELRAMVNLDMVGRLRDCRLYVEGRDSSPTINPAVDRANTTGFDTRPWDVVRHGPWGRSDHHSFQDAGVPVAFLFTGLHPDYHRPEDDPDRIVYPGLAAVVTFAERLLRELAR
ncbi:MAG: M28 family peptidase [Deltaproteobacteria bacterium]|nr:M28 family peptidase [Deltaproteobacteria bacterium]